MPFSYTAHWLPAFLRKVLPDLTLKMEVICFSQMLVTTYKTMSQGSSVSIVSDN
jgi:hypothetical protein